MWLAHVTVAAVIENDRNEFLLVEECIAGEQVLNQPAGHWEAGESLVEAVQREVLEETARAFEPHYIIGIYSYKSPVNHITYLRVAFAGGVGTQLQRLRLDKDIMANHWLDSAALLVRVEQFRSPLVKRCIADYQAGQRYPLALLQHMG